MFVDTGVLVHARIWEAPNHELARAGLARAVATAGGVKVSRQVLREYLAVMTRPQTWPAALTREQALSDVERLAANFTILEDGPLVTEALLKLCRDVQVAGPHIHDASIVATMLAHGERQLLTFNTADFEPYRNRIALVTV